MHDGLLPIGWVARAFGVAVPPLRDYNRLGLLSPGEWRGNVRRTANSSWSASRSFGLAKDAGGCVVEPIAIILPKVT